MKLAITRSLLKMTGLAPLLCCFAIAQQSAGTAAPSLNSIVQGMEKSQSEVRPQTPYQVIREYSLFGMKSSSANADVVAQVDFKSPTGKDYSIQKWSGSTRGKQIVQRVLDHETEASKGNQARTALTRDNYDFILMGDTVLDGRPCYVLGLKPKRKEKDLVSGSAWVDKSSFLILHVEGETAKAPSWWLKSVRIKLSFGDFSGAWLQTSMEAVADVRLLGFHTLRSRILDYRGSDISASIKLAPTRTQVRSQDPRH
jgi:outer membrane lipoprotein-sorting protein